MFADSSLFLLASSLRTLLAQHIEGIDIGDVLIGTPRQAKEAATTDQGPTHALNVFFYRFEPGTYPSAALPSEPLYLRTHCLLTAFASKSSAGEDMGSAGQNDLRLLGEAMRVLHQHPTLSLPGHGDTVALVQIVPASLSIHEINHIWSMMGSEVGYRPSVAYELALVPIPLTQTVDRRPRVEAVQVDVLVHEEARP
jgi:Pvc16 N-terminal domain